MSTLTPNDRLKKIDESLSLINTSLGLGRGYKNGIIPAFPLYILIILGSNSDIKNRLDSPMSSYGHCYQLLISLAFQNCGVQNDTIDSYINFLTYFAIFLYKHGDTEISKRDFEVFLEEYQSDYKIFELETYLSKLFLTGLIKKSNSSYYGFAYEYLYYFFVGKYFSEHFEESFETIQNIVEHLDSDKNGNICIFIAHHCKDERLIQILNNSLEKIFSKYSPSTLNRVELGNFDDSICEILNNLKVKIDDHSEARKKELERLDKIEKNHFEDYESESNETESVELDRYNPWC